MVLYYMDYLLTLVSDEDFTKHRAFSLPLMLTRLKNRPSVGRRRSQRPPRGPARKQNCRDRAEKIQRIRENTLLPGRRVDVTSIFVRGFVDLTRTRRRKLTASRTTETIVERNRYQTLVVGGGRIDSKQNPTDNRGRGAR